jgi:hypothetical protein
MFFEGQAGKGVPTKKKIFLKAPNLNFNKFGLTPLP